MLSFDVSFERAKLLEKEPTVMVLELRKKYCFIRNMLWAKREYNCDVVIASETL